MAKSKKLNDDEIAQAQAYAEKRWPDESVTIEAKTNDDGKIVFRRIKTSTRKMGAVAKKPKQAKPA